MDGRKWKFLNFFFFIEIRVVVYFILIFFVGDWCRVFEEEWNISFLGRVKG